MGNGAAGLPCGTLERPELAEAVLAKLGVRLPAPLLEAARRQGAYPIGLPLAAVAEAMAASSSQVPSAKPRGTGLAPRPSQRLD
jgi:hypothetical protein